MEFNGKLVVTEVSGGDEVDEAGVSRYGLTMEEDADAFASATGGVLDAGLMITVEVAEGDREPQVGDVWIVAGRLDQSHR